MRRLGRRSSLLALAVLVAASAVARSAVTAGAPQSGAPEAVRFELPNGLRVWIQEDHRRPVVRVEVLYKVGWINEGPGITGIAHYVEHMVFRAAEGVPNEDIFGFIDRIGGRWTGGTGQMGTSYAETVPSWALDGVLRIEAGRMGRALFDPVEFERERSSVITEANGYVATDPVEVLNDELLAASFELHPYRYGSGTWARDNLTVTRDETYDFYRRYYGPDNAVLAVVGDVTLDEARALVAKHFGPLDAAGRSGEVTLVEPPQRTAKRLALVAPAAEGRVEIVYRAPAADDPDYPVLAVLDRVLAAEGRLPRAISAAGGTDVTTSFRPTPYPYVYRISVSAGPSADPDLLLAAVQGEIDRLAREGATAEEIAAARDAAGRAGGGGRRGGGRRGGGRGGGGSSLPPSDPRPAITQIATALTEGEVFPWEVSPARLEEARRAQDEVTAADVIAYADRWLRSSQRTAGFLIAGDSDFMPRWSDARPIVGDRLEIPPLTVSPAPRRRPEAAPGRALQPLPDAGIATARRRLDNGIVLRAARRDGPARATEPAGTPQDGVTAALQVRVRLDDPLDPPGKEGLTLLAARLLGTDPQLRAVIDGAGAALDDSAHQGAAEAVNLGYLDIRSRFRASDLETMAAAIARALSTVTVPMERIEQERARLLDEIERERAARAQANPREATRRRLPALGAEVRARNRVLAAIAPGWNTGIPATPEGLRSITDADVAARLSRLLAGNALVVSLVGPGDPDRLLDALETAFASHPAASPRSAAAPVSRSGAPAATGASSTPGPGGGVSMGAAGASTPASRQARNLEPSGPPVIERIPLAGEFQSTIVAGLPGVARGDPDAAALELLNYVVGMPYYGGRLGWALTKGGLAYSSGAATTFGAVTGHVLVNTDCDTNNLPATLQAIGEIVAQIGEEGVAEWELREAQASTLGRMVLYGPGADSDEQTLAEALLDSETTGVEMLDYPARSRAVLAVTLDQIEAAARRFYRPQLLHIVAIGALPPPSAASPFPPGTFRDLFER